MDIAEFQLKLTSDTATASRQAVRDVKAAEDAMKRLSSSSVKIANQQHFSKIMNAPHLGGVAKMQRQLVAQQNQKNTKIQALRNLGRHEEANQLAGTPSTLELVSKGMRAAGFDIPTTKLAELGVIAAGVAAAVFTIKEAFDFVKWSVESVLSAGWELGKMLVSNVAAAMDFAQGSKLAFGTLLDDQQQGAAVFDKVRHEAVELGLDVETAVDSFRKLLAAQFSVGDSNELLRVGADLQAIGATADEVKHALLAISQIKMKGKLQAEELTRQLANAGVSSELVYQALQKRMGIPLTPAGRTKVMGMQKKGEIGADIAIPAIIDAIKAKTHEKNAGDTAKTRVGATLESMKKYAHDTIGNTFTDIAEVIEKPVMEAVNTVFGTFKRLMASPIMEELKTKIADTFIAAAGFITEYWPQVEPVILAVMDRLVNFFASAKNYIANNGDDIANKIGLIARVVYSLGNVMISVTGIVLKLVDALLSIAQFFAKYGSWIPAVLGLVAAPMTGGMSILPGLAMSGLAASVSSPISGDVNKSGPGLVEQYKNVGNLGEVNDLLKSIDERKAGFQAPGKESWKTIGSVNVNTTVNALDLSDPEVAGGKLGDLVRRNVHQVLEDSAQ